MKKIYLNGVPIDIDNYTQETQEGMQKVCVTFQVTTEEYHDITTLLYEGNFDVNVPERDLLFKGTILEYSTSITNLYKEGQVGDFRLCLCEIKRHSKG